MSGAINKNETEISHDDNVNDHRNIAASSSSITSTTTIPGFDISKYTKFAQKLEKDPISYLDRYYQKLYFLDPDEVKQEDFYVYRPPNGLCVLGLAPTHPLIREASTSSYFNSSTTEHSERSIIVSIAFNKIVTSSAGKVGKKNRLFRPNNNLCSIAVSRLPQTSSASSSALLTNLVSELETIIKHDKSASITEKSYGDIRDFITKNPKFEKHLLDIKFPVTGFLVDWNEKIVNNPEYLFEKPYSEGYIAIIKPQKQEPPELKKWVTEAEYQKLRFGIVVSTEETNDQFIVDEEVSNITTAIHENASTMETDMTDEDNKIVDSNDD
ncbi:8770_t:CDS:2 [Ambispora leptoticha]|uniref:Protein Abitram n=1 Tax=Ambispora leptoticha TaxID=144679 RepID=A0A9N9F7P0_9GLOM|nr:8770_t:CDS:2 [Ambispora leptoticha]